MTDEQRTLSGNFEVTIVLTDKRQLRMTGYVYSDDTPHAINARIDGFMDVIDRQAVRADVHSKEAEISTAEASLEQLIAHNEELIGLQKGGKLNSQQKQQIAQFEASARFHVKRTDSLRAAVVAGKKKLNGAA